MKTFSQTEHTSNVVDGLTVTSRYRFLDRANGINERTPISVTFDLSAVSQDQLVNGLTEHLKISNTVRKVVSAGVKSGEREFKFTVPADLFERRSAVVKQVNVNGIIDAAKSGKLSADETARLIAELQKLQAASTES